MSILDLFRPAPRYDQSYCIADFSGLDLHGAILSGNFTSADFTGATLTAALLSGRFDDARGLR
jgi:uncharacterized protein YjbI with pentapeptide repeats